jgi:hypothetical protein
MAIDRQLRSRGSLPLPQCVAACGHTQVVWDRGPDVHIRPPHLSRLDTKQKYIEENRPLVLLDRSSTTWGLLCNGQSPRIQKVLWI